MTTKADQALQALQETGVVKQPHELLGFDEKLKLPSFKKIKKMLKKFKKSKPKKSKNAFDAAAFKKRNGSKLASFFKKAFKGLKLSESEEDKIDALADHLDYDAEDKESIEATSYGPFECDDGEYLVLTDSEADDAVKDYIEESIWAFNTDFLMEHITLSDLISYLGIETEYYDEDEDEYVEIEDEEEAFYMATGYNLEEWVNSIKEKYESGNAELLRAIDDIDDFVEDAISADGRGHFLSSYDGDEHEQGSYYIYKTN